MRSRCSVASVSILLHSGLPLEDCSDMPYPPHWRRFNPTSFRITVGRPLGLYQRPENGGFQSYFIQDYRWKITPDFLAQLLSEFQSYFIQDYRWKILRQFTLVRHDASFNPTSFRITVGRLSGSSIHGFIHTSFNPTSFRITVGRSVVSW